MTDPVWDDLLALGSYQPTTWWRVISPDNSVWCETSNESEARGKPYGLAAAASGSKLQRMYIQSITKWIDEESA